MLDKSFEKLPVGKAVMRQGLPSIISQLIVLLYNWADAYFVGKLSDPDQLAAVTVVAPLFLMLTAIANLTGVGGCALLSTYLGAKKQEDASRVSSISFWLGLVFAILYSAIFLCLGKSLLTLTGASIQTMEYAMDYAFWVIVIGSIPVILTQILANMVRAIGMAKEASLGISLGGMLNIVLDPFFVLPQFAGCGVKGAGIATVLSNTLALCYFFILLKKRQTEGILSLKLHLLVGTKEHLLKILERGLPSSIQYLLTVVAVGAQAHFVAKYGSQATAALAVVKELDFLPLYFSIGLSQGMLPLIAYCYGSGDSKRRREIYRFGTKISVGFALVCFICYECFAMELGRFFINDSATNQYIVSFLRCMVVAMPFMAYCYPTITNFQATGHIKEAMICTMLRKGVLDIPLLFIYDFLWPLYGCMWVQPTVDLISMLIAICFIRKFIRQHRKEDAITSVAID